MNKIMDITVRAHCSVLHLHAEHSGVLNRHNTRAGKNIFVSKLLKSSEMFNLLLLYSSVGKRRM